SFCFQVDALHSFGTFVGTRYKVIIDTGAAVSVAPATIKRLTVRSSSRMIKMVDGRVLQTSHRKQLMRVSSSTLKRSLTLSLIEEYNIKLLTPIISRLMVRWKPW